MSLGADDKGSLECPHCAQSFDHSGHLHRHIQSAHSDKKPFKCTECPKAYKRADHLKRHMRTHTGERPFKCDKCKAAFACAHHLKRHQLSQHTTVQQYQCDECDETFNKKQGLKKHQADVHGRLAFKCRHSDADGNECDRAFRSVRELARHRRVHEGKSERDERPKKKRKLQKHEKRKSSLKSHVCPECGKSYSKASNLKTHMRVRHSEDSKPHKCECGKAYAHAHSLRAHLASGLCEKQSGSEQRRQEQERQRLEARVISQILSARPQTNDLQIVDDEDTDYVSDAWTDAHALSAF
ncbi:MAG: hypothetical protein MHM6MM_001144 [Cercozoa sp. M6MM]